MTYKLEPLPYAYDALEPFIDKKTMELHHSKHHQAYVDKLNLALDGHPDLQKMSPEELLKDLNKLPSPVRMAVRNHGGGHLNHSFFWKILKKDVKPKAEILKAIESGFGSFDEFKQEFSKAALAFFGSGWVWLVVDGKELKIISTQNQDSPLDDSVKPVFCIDLWEHAYYVKHQNRKADYIADFWNVVNWDKVNELYKKAIK